MIIPQYWSFVHLHRKIYIQQRHIASPFRSSHQRKVNLGMATCLPLAWAFGAGAMMQHTRRFSDSDSGGSATFSIDFNRADSNSLNSSQNGSSQNECDVRDSTGASFLRERGDKENSSMASRNSSLRNSDQSCDSGKHLRRSQDAIPENRPVLGSMPFNNWDKNVRMSRDKNPSPDLCNEVRI